MIPRRVAYVLNIFPKLSETFIAGELAELKRRGVELRILSLLPPRAELQHDLVKRAGSPRSTACHLLSPRTVTTFIANRLRILPRGRRRRGRWSRFRKRTRLTSRQPSAYRAN